MATPALYVPKQTVVDVIQDGEEMAFVKFPGGKAIWVKSSDLDFDNLVAEDDVPEPQSDDYIFDGRDGQIADYGHTGF